MRIGIDARPLQHETQFRGIGKSLEFLLMAMKDLLKPSDRLVFYIDAGLPRPKILEHYPDSNVMVVASSNLARKRYVRSVLSSFRPIKPSPKNIDVLLQYDATFGVPQSVPTVVLFHDLIPYLFRDQEKKLPAAGMRRVKNSLAGKLYWQKYLRTWKQYKRASAILAISQSSRNDFLQHIASGRTPSVSVVHLGTGQFHNAGNASPKIRSLVKDPYLLYVGGIDFRKNVIGLLETFFRLKQKYPRLKLVTVGKEFGLEDQLGDLGWFKLLRQNKAYAKDVIAPGYIEPADLHHLYTHASAFVFTSRYEGFGLPVLEAMQAGCPVVAYDNSSIPEVAGDAALLVPDGTAIEPAIEQVLKDKKLRATLIAKGKHQAAKFTWEKTAHETLQVLKKAAQ